MPPRDLAPLTVRCGLSALAVSAINHTPAKEMTSPSKSRALAREFQAVAHDIGERLNLGLLIMVRKQNGAAVALEIENFFGDEGPASIEIRPFPSV